MKPTTVVITIDTAGHVTNPGFWKSNAVEIAEAIKTAQAPKPQSETNDWAGVATIGIVALFGAFILRICLKD